MRGQEEEACPVRRVFGVKGFYTLERNEKKKNKKRIEQNKHKQQT